MGKQTLQRVTAGAYRAGREWRRTLAPLPFAGGDGDLTNDLLFAGGLVLLPGWLTGTARMAAVSAA
jgi:hypothetical protein